MHAYAPNPVEWVDPLGLSAKQLKQNMVIAGRRPVSGQTPHHIVQENCNKNPYVSNSREILKRNGVDINDSPNGAYLWGTHPSQEKEAAHPGKAMALQQGNRHSGVHVHSSINDKIVYQVLKGVDKRGGSIENALSDIGGRMESGAWKKSFECCCGE